MLQEVQREQTATQHLSTSEELRFEVPGNQRD